MRSIAESIERGLASANYHADLASKRRALSAWGTVERKGSGWSWRWSGLGLALPELLPQPVSCMSADAVWLAMDLTVSDYVRRIGAGG
jgi:hypothetical protein